MKFPATMRTAVLAVTGALCLQTGLHLTYTQETTTNTGFPYIIAFEPGTSAFAAGDSITIASLMGDRQHIEPDGSYLVQGSYALTSADRAVLLFSCTSRGPSGPTPIGGGQETEITRGTGTFSLKHTKPCDGWFHVSFYVANEAHSHGGIYFGEKGNERTILRIMDWPDLSSDSRGERPDRRVVVNDTSGISSDPANLAIVAYLGRPVPAPVSLDAKYTPTNLVTAFTAMSKKASWRIQRVAVDDSEFPFLVYGVLTGKHDFREVQNSLREMRGYKYGGSVVGTTDNESTYFSLNMIPEDQYPIGQTVACHRRLMIRLQMLADSVRQLQ